MKTLYHGSCHCGAIRFSAEIDLDDGIRKCNCRFCWKLGYRKSFAAPDAVSVEGGFEGLAEYLPADSAWPAGDIQHYFCRTCGAHPFSRGYLEKEMGGHFFAVNVACLDDVSEEALAAAPAIYEDGKRDRQLEAPAITGYL